MVSFLHTHPPIPLAGIETPALVFNRQAFERNLQRMQLLADRCGMRLRPHFKSHKSTEIAKLQVASGAVGICCQTVEEAEVAAAAGIGDILVTNQIVHVPKLGKLAGLTHVARIGLCFDDVAQVDLVAKHLSGRDGVLDAYVEIDVGGRRCGVQSPEAAVALAKRIGEVHHLRLAGLQAYNGRAQHMRSTDERRSAAAAVAKKVAEVRAALAQAGLNCTLATGGGTGTWAEDIEAGALSELQPGSYLFMDGDYARNSPSANGHFEHSLFVIGTVISRSPGHFVIDAGLKALAVDSGFPDVIGLHASYDGASDEHGRLVMQSGTAPEIGTQVRLIPGHCDPTINLFGRIVLEENDNAIGYVEVDARRV